MTRRFIHRFQVKANLESVLAFHKDVQVLKMLTPPPVIVQIHEAEPLAEGSSADLTMWFGLIPIHWVAQHTRIDPYRGFTDIQVRGPFYSWTHHHRFKELTSNLVEIEDEITADMGSGFWHGLMSRFMWMNLKGLFAYRSWATRRALERSK